MFDHVIQRNERLSKAIGGDTEITLNGCCKRDVNDTSIDKSDESTSESKKDSKPETAKDKPDVDKENKNTVRFLIPDSYQTLSKSKCRISQRKLDLLKQLWQIKDIQFKFDLKVFRTYDLEINEKE